MESGERENRVREDVERDKESWRGGGRQGEREAGRERGTGREKKRWRGGEREDRGRVNNTSIANLY